MTLWRTPGGRVVGGRGGHRASWGGKCWVRVEGYEDEGRRAPVLGLKQAELQAGVRGRGSDPGYSLRASHSDGVKTLPDSSFLSPSSCKQPIWHSKGVLGETEGKQVREWPWECLAPDFCGKPEASELASLWRRRSTDKEGVRCQALQSSSYPRQVGQVSGRDPKFGRGGAVRRWGPIGKPSALGALFPRPPQLCQRMALSLYSPSSKRAACATQVDLLLKFQDMEDQSVAKSPPTARKRNF